MKKGFTLIEVMFALFILLVGITGVVKMYGTGATLTKTSGDNSYAQNLAKTVLNHQLARPASILYSGAPACTLPSGISSTNLHNHTTYTINCSITLNTIGSIIVGEPNNPSGYVRVDITWDDNLNVGALKTHTVTSTGLIVKK